MIYRTVSVVCAALITWDFAPNPTLAVGCTSSSATDRDDVTVERASLVIEAKRVDIESSAGDEGDEEEVCTFGARMFSPPIIIDEEKLARDDEPENERFGTAARTARRVAQRALSDVERQCIQGTISLRSAKSDRFKTDFVL